MSNGIDRAVEYLRSMYSAHYRPLPGWPPPGRRTCGRVAGHTAGLLRKQLPHYLPRMNSDPSVGRRSNRSPQPSNSGSERPGRSNLVVGHSVHIPVSQQPPATRRRSSMDCRPVRGG
jgi:hypothetical protein